MSMTTNVEPKDRRDEAPPPEKSWARHDEVRRLVEQIRQARERREQSPRKQPTTR